jgi:hypothetical protein
MKHKFIFKFNRVDKTFELKTELQKSYFRYVVKKIQEAQDQSLTCRITINIRSGIIDNLQEVNNIAGISTTNYFLSEK